MLFPEYYLAVFPFKFMYYSDVIPTFHPCKRWKNLIRRYVHVTPAMPASNVPMTRLGAGAGAEQRGATENLQKVEDVRLEIYQRDTRPSFIACLKVRDNIAVIVADFLPELLRKIARTILAWEAIE